MRIMAPVSSPEPTPVPTLPLAVGTVVTAWVIGLTGLVGPTLVAVALGLGVVLLAWGWAGTLGLPTPRGTVAVLLLGGSAIVLSVALRTEPPWLTWLPAALAVSLIVAFGHQLLRRDGRPRVADSVTSVLFGLAVLTSGIFAIPLARTDPGSAVLIGAVAAAAASSLTDLVLARPHLRPWTAPAALVAGGAAGVVTALLTAQPWSVLLLVGVASGGVSHAVRSLFGTLPPLAHSRPRLVASLTSVLLVLVLPYVVALALLPDALPG